MKVHNAVADQDSVHNKYKENAEDQPQQPQMERPPENQEELKPKGGVSGKYQWPIRIISFLIYIGMVLGNYLGGMETIMVSNVYKLYVTPPPLFFIIWAVIFAFMGLVQIYNLWKNRWTLETHVYIGIQNLLLIIWVNVFGIGTDVAVYICFPIIVCMVAVTAKAWHELGKIQKPSFFIYATRNVYAFYQGWILAATNLNFGILIKFWWGASYGAQMVTFWIMVPALAQAGFIYALVAQKKKGVKSYLGLWISLIWAVVGAAITSEQCSSDPTICISN